MNATHLGFGQCQLYEKEFQEYGHEHERRVSDVEPQNQKQ